MLLLSLIYLKMLPESTTCDGYYIKTANLSILGPDYLSWVNNFDVTRYLEFNGTKSAISLVDLREYLISFENNAHKYLFSFHDCNDLHIGNISIHSINPVNRTFDMGYLIGNQEYWNTPAAEHCLACAFDFAFFSLGLRKHFGAIVVNNKSALFAARKVGINFYGRQSDKNLIDGVPCDALLTELDLSSWLYNRERYFGQDAHQ